MGRAKSPKQYIKDAVLCGKLPPMRKWQTLPTNKLTKGEKVLRFSADYLCFGEGRDVGKPLILVEWQQYFVLAAFDETGAHISKAILSVGRRSGKSLVLAVILLCYLIGSLAKENTVIASAAQTREQAGILWRLMNLILEKSPAVANLWRAVPSGKRHYGLTKNVEYRSLSRDASSNLGVAFYAVCIDEAGAIVASHDDFLSAILSSMGTYDDSKEFYISTQAPSDSAFFSLELDTAAREQPANTVAHLYTAPTDDILDQKNWYAANPALHDGYRSFKDIQNSANDAFMIPQKQNGFLLYFMNRRVSMDSIWLAPTVWRANNAMPDWDVFRENGVIVGLDLSKRNDLTVACMSAIDQDGYIHVYPFCFTPQTGIEDRERRDKVPYTTWVKQGHLVAVAGATIDYEWVAEYLRIHIEEEGITISSIEFDRWRINEFKSACERMGLECYNFNMVGQGFKDISVRVEAMESSLLQNKIRHGEHPVLNLGASSAIIVEDPSGNRKIEKAKSAQKVDAIIAMLMSIYPHIAQTEEILGDDLSWMIG